MRTKAYAALPAVAVLALAPAVAATRQAPPSGYPAVDSAAVARQAYARAASALRAGDAAGARREVLRAATAWPTQPAYQWARVVVGLRTADTGMVLAGLAAYADLGLGRDLAADSALSRLSSLPAFRPVAARHAANVAPLVRSRPVAVLPDSTFFPEGVDADPRSGLMYVASIRHRTIAELTPGGDYVRELLPRGGTGLGAVLGVRVDPRRGVLWATMAAIPQMAGFESADSATHLLVKLTLPEGEIAGRWRLPPAPDGHTLGDVGIGPLGDVFVTDSRDPVLYHLADDADTLRAIRHPLFRSLQGVAPAPGGRVVFVADYSHGLLKVDVISGEVTRLADAPNATSLGCDGLAWHNGSLIAVQNGVAPARVMRFELDAAWTRITRADVLDRNSAIADEPTIGTIVNDEFVYVANSQWEKYDERGTRIPGTTLRRPVLLAVRLP